MKAQELTENTLCRLLITEENPVNGWKIIEETLISSDEEYGGGEYEYILQNLETGKFYMGYRTDWNIENTDFNDETGEVEGRCDLSTNIFEVEPVEVTKTIYKRIS